jgi:hypothetical protein
VDECKPLAEGEAAGEAAAADPPAPPVMITPAATFVSGVPSGAVIDPDSSAVVGRCRLTLSNPTLQAIMVSALEAAI